MVITGTSGFAPRKIPLNKILVERTLKPGTEFDEYYALEMRPDIFYIYGANKPTVISFFKLDFIDTLKS
jgi:hypothetical protein